MSNVEKFPVKPRQDGPAVTLIGTNLPAPYLEEAEPSPLMYSATAWWSGLRRFIQIAGIIAIIGFYPALVAGSHSINDDPVILSAERPWASPQTGIMVTLIGRELEGPGWASDRAGWHPQARLTALPAWQASISASMSEFARMLASKSPTGQGNPDPDLSAAGRLLAIDPELAQTPRLAAAAEALARYEGRLERGLATSPNGLEDTLDQLALLASWSDWSRLGLGEQIAKRDGWPASRDDVRAFYTARARAHVASELLVASIMAEPETVISDAVHTRIDRLQASWRRAATLNPLIVSSQSGDARLMADHLAMMAFYIGEAGDATRELGGALIAEQDAREKAAAALISRQEDSPGAEAE